MITVGETYQSDAYDVLNPAVLDVDGHPTPTTGTTVTIDVVLPDLSLDSATPDETSPGTYVFAYTTTRAGRHEFSVTATAGFLGSTVVELGGDVFNVEPATSGALVGLREAKDRLGIERDIVDDDEEIRAMLVAASQLVEQETRLWHRATVTETFPAGRTPVLSQLPVVSVTSIGQVGSTPVDGSGVEVDPAGVLTPLYGSVVWPWAWPNTNRLTVTYEAGEEVVPVAVRQAVLVTLDEMWSAQRGPAALPLANDDDEFEASTGYALPAAAQKLLEPWRKLPGIA